VIGGDVRLRAEGTVIVGGVIGGDVGLRARLLLVGWLEKMWGWGHGYCWWGDWRRCKAEGSAPSSTETKNQWRCLSTLPIHLQLLVKVKTGLSHAKQEQTVQTIALHFPNTIARKGVLLSFKSGLLYPQKKSRYQFYKWQVLPLREPEWVQRISPPLLLYSKRPARVVSLYRLSYPGRPCSIECIIIDNLCQSAGKSPPQLQRRHLNYKDATSITKTPPQLQRRHLNYKDATSITNSLPYRCIWNGHLSIWSYVTGLWDKCAELWRLFACGNYRVIESCIGWKLSFCSSVCSPHRGVLSQASTVWVLFRFRCFTVHFNSLNFTHQLMHFYI